MEMRAFALQLEQRDKALLEKYELHQKAEKQKVLKLNSERMEISEAIHRQEKDRKLKLMLEREDYKQRTLREWEQQRLAEEERKRTTFTKLREIQEEEIVAKLERDEARKQAQLAEKESASAYAKLLAELDSKRDEALQKIKNFDQVKVRNNSYLDREIQSKVEWQTKQDQKMLKYA